MDASRPTEPAAGRAVEERAAEWLARRDGGDWGAADDAALAAWISADIAHRVAYLRLQAAWDESGRLQALGAGWHGDGPPPRGHWHATPETRREQLLAAIAQRQAPRHPQRSSRLLHMAAVAALGACALVAGWGWRSWTHVDAASYRTALGKVESLPLADGSHATLASDSAIEVRLSRGERRVELPRGEAIFKVAKDPGRPFVVVAGDRHVVAVGTRFSVRRDGPDLRVVVTEGTVRLESAGADGALQPSALLPAGSVALVRRDGVLVRSVALAEAEQLLDWREGLLAFRDTTLAEAAAEFNRYNARKLVVADAAAAELRIGGNFRWDNQDAFVRLLEAGFPVRAERQTDRVVLHSR